jgi:ribosome-associated protein
MNPSINKKLILEISFDFIRSTGPGGQNVNKVSSAVQLHFDIPNSNALSDLAKKRLLSSVKNKLDKNGVLTITARRFRTQERNRKDAVDRFLMLVESSGKVPHKRVYTKPTHVSRERRIQTKKKRGEIKKYRKSIQND